MDDFHDLLDEGNVHENSDPHSQIPLPNAQTGFVLGILSIVPGACCGCIGLILGIIGLIMSSNAIKAYDANPGMYYETDYKQAKNGKILSIVGLVLFVVSVTIQIIYQIFVVGLSEF